MVILRHWGVLLMDAPHIVAALLIPMFVVGIKVRYGKEEIYGSTIISV